MKFLFTYGEDEYTSVYKFQDERALEIFEGNSEKKSSILSIKDSKGFVIGVIESRFSFLRKECDIRINGKKVMTVIKKPGINAVRFSVEGSDLKINETSWNYSYRVSKDDSLIFTAVFKENRGLCEIIDESMKETAILMTCAIFKIIK